MADGKIYITISDERKGGGGGGSVAGKKEEKSQARKTSDFIAHEFYGVLKQNASKVANYTLGNIGNFTGNYLAQEDVNILLNNLGTLYSIGMSALAGGKVGGIIGAVVGAGVGVVNQAVSFALGEKTQQFNYKRTNIEIAQMRELSGLNGLTNGSR